MSSYQYRIFVDRQGTIDYVRKQPASSSVLADNVDRFQAVIPVNSVSDIFDGDLSGIQLRQFVRNIKIQPLLLAAVADGTSNVFLHPDFWNGNPITVTANGVPQVADQDYVLQPGRVVFAATPTAGTQISLTVVVDLLRMPTLIADPLVELHDVALVAGTDYVLQAQQFTTDIVFANTLSINDNVRITAEYNRSGAEVVWINNERIEFYGVDLDNNLLLQCQRGTQTTNARAHSAGTVVWDGSQRQSLLRAAAQPSTLFTEADVRSFPWKQEILDFLSE